MPKTPQREVGRGWIRRIGCVGLLCVAAGLAAADETTGKGRPTADEPARKADEEVRRAAEAERFFQLFLRRYNEQLDAADWVTRAMGVISLARIDDARTTQRLLDVLTNDAAPIVRAYAWEALHARRDRLTAEQQQTWEDQGYVLYKQHVLRGDMRLGLLGIIEARGPTDRNHRLLKYMLNTTNSMDSRDIRTLWKIGDIIAAWQDRQMIRHLIKAMGNLDTAYRAELVLHRVCDAVPLSYTAGALPPEHRGHPKHRLLRHEGSDVMWKVTQHRWMEWFEEQSFEAPAGDGEAESRYTGVGTLLPAGQKISDPRNEQWTRELELPRFRIGNLDVGIVMDSTASMGRVIRWVQRDVVKLMRTFQTISREPRIGVILYRDEGDDYIVRGIRLTGSAAKLKASLQEAGAKGGGDMPEAVYAALYTMLNKQRWSKGASTRKVVILLGDAPPHEQNMPKIRELVAEAVQENFQFHCVKVRTYHTHYFMRHLKKKNWDPKLTSFDRIADWGGGRSFWVSFMAEYGHRAQRTARPTSGQSPARLILYHVLCGLLAEAYHDRIDPFLNILLEFVQEPLDEKRQPFGPRTYGHGPGRPPSDPQEQR